MGALREFVSKFKYDKALIGTVDTLTGKPIIPAAGRPNNYVYIRILSGQEAGTLTTARNDSVAPIYNTQVRIQKDFALDEWVVKGIDPKFNLANPLAAIYSVTFHRHFINSGLDDPVEQRRLIPGRTWSPGGLVINVDPFVYQHDGVNQQFPGITGVDISSHVPSSGLQRFLISTINPVTNTLSLIDGPTFSAASLPTYVALLAIATGGNILSAGISLANGITNISETNILDLRPAVTAVDTPIVIGPITSTNKAIATWNGLEGDKLNDNPNATIDTNGNLTANEYKLHAGVATTLASDAFTVTSGFHILEAQTGTTDNLVTINGGSGVQELTIQADADDTIIIKTGADNIFLNGGTDFSLSGDKSLRLFYDGTNWSDIGAGGGGSAFYQTIQDTGVDQTQRSKLDFVGATITDDAGNDRTVVTLAGGGSGITKTVKTFYQRTVLYDNTLGSAGVWDVSSIDQTYDHLEIIIVGKATEAVANENVNISFNNDTTDSNYLLDQFFELNAVAGASTNLGVRLEALTIGSSGDSNKFATYLGTILDYSNSSFHKLLQGQSSVHNASGSSSFILSRIMTWKNTAAINRIAIEVANATNTFVTGSRLQIIGIKQEDVVTDVSGTGTVQFTQTATVTVSNTATETTLVGSGVGSATFGANALNAVGRTIRLKIQGILSDLGSSPGNLTINVKLGSTVLVTTGVVALTAGLTNALWELEVTGTIRTIGSSGTIMTQGVLRIINSLADISEPLTNGTSIITIDFTSSLVVDVTCTFSTTSSSNNMTSLTCVLEVLN